MNRGTNRNKGKKVLILDAGEAPYALVAARSLGSAGYNVVLGFPHCTPIFESYSKYCKGYVTYPDPSYALEDFHAFMLNQADKYDFILPLMEKTQLATSMIKDKLEKEGAVIPIPSYHILSIAVNKIAILELASKLHITIPKTLIVYDEPKFNEVIKELGIPFVMKISTEINVPPGKRHFIIRKASEKQFIEKFRRLQKYGVPIIIQEYIDGIGIGASFIFSRSNKLIALFGHRRILEQYPDGGPSAIAETFFHSEVLKQGYKLLKALKWQGVAMTEFKLSKDGKPYFMELNPRFWGTLPLSIASGLDFPRLLVEYYNKEERNNKILNYKLKTFVSIYGLGIFILSSTSKISALKKLFVNIPQIFKYGTPVVRELYKMDIYPEIKRIIHMIRGYIYKNNIAKIDGILFGPAIDYQKLVNFNVKYVVNLCKECETVNIDILKEHGIAYYSFPIEDDSAPPIDAFVFLIAQIDKMLKRGPVYIHCRLGMGRSPMVVIGYLISRGFSIDEAYSIIFSVRPSARLNIIQKKTVYNLYKFYKYK
jgi:predicted ATP-grasp superfamily ATP-dependent carboligase/protein-tyrosine phosphatase